MCMYPCACMGARPLDPQATWVVGRGWGFTGRGGCFFPPCASPPQLNTNTHTKESNTASCASPYSPLPRQATVGNAAGPLSDQDVEMDEVDKESPQVGGGR